MTSIARMYHVKFGKKKKNDRKVYIKFVGENMKIRME